MQEHMHLAGKTLLRIAFRKPVCCKLQVITYKLAETQLPPISRGWLPYWPQLLLQWLYRECRCTESAMDMDLLNHAWETMQEGTSGRYFHYDHIYSSFGHVLEIDQGLNWALIKLNRYLRHSVQWQCHNCKESERLPKVHSWAICCVWNLIK